MFIHVLSNHLRISMFQDIYPDVLPIGRFSQEPIEIHGSFLTPKTTACPPLSSLPTPLLCVHRHPGSPGGRAPAPKSRTSWADRLRRRTKVDSPWVWAAGGEERGSNKR